MAIFTENTNGWYYKYRGDFIESRPAEYIANTKVDYNDNVIINNESQSIVLVFFGTEQECWDDINTKGIEDGCGCAYFPVEL